MAGTMTDLKDPVPLDERQHTQDPILPSAHRDGCRDQIVCEGELVIKKAKEKAQEGFHERSNPVNKRAVL
jgi:hypothetical protein